MTAYLMTVAMGIPLSGWLAERLGARRVFCLAIAIFTAASLLCALSQDLTMLTLSRVLQGAGGAMMVPVGTLVVLRGTPEEGAAAGHGLPRVARAAGTGPRAAGGRRADDVPVLALDLPGQPPPGRWPRSWPPCASCRPPPATGTRRLDWLGLALTTAGRGRRWWWAWSSPAAIPGVPWRPLSIAAGLLSLAGGRAVDAAGAHTRCSTCPSSRPGRSGRRPPAALSTA